MFTSLQPIAKALVAGVIGMGAGYLNQQFHINVPLDMQDTISNLGVAAIGGLLTGGLTWAIPNVTSNRKQQRQARRQRRQQNNLSSTIM